jgi:SAM-dependent methyltransferase
MSLTTLSAERSDLSAERSEFDAVAEDYETNLQMGLKASGESSDFFAASRAAWTRRRLDRFSFPFEKNKAIDFGCGIGNSIPHLRESLGFSRVVGLDPSIQSLQIAKRLHPHPSIHFATPAQYQDRGDADFVFCNGVFHHIAPSERAAALRHVHDCLAAGGVFAYWENNPWNPGTRYVMKRIPFDRDAIPLTIRESRRRLAHAGFKVLCIDTCFYFPRWLKWLRAVEPYLCKLPLGAQYLILAQKWK